MDNHYFIDFLNTLTINELVKVIVSMKKAGDDPTLIKQASDELKKKIKESLK